MGRRAAVVVRRLGDADVPTVLELNAESVLALSPMGPEELAFYRTLTPHLLVAARDESVAAFSIAYEPGTAYPSVNYAWHGDRFDDFLYLDRIVVASAHRRRGIATVLYDELESVARSRGRMVCEVNSDPPNLASLAFHAARGYREVGHLRQRDGHETVMLEKPL